MENSQPRQTAEISPRQPEQSDSGGFRVIAVGLVGTIMFFFALTLCGVIVNAGLVGSGVGVFLGVFFGWIVAVRIVSNAILS